MTLGAKHIPPTTTGAYPLRDGNYVRPLVDGGPAFRRICEAVEAAHHSVWVTVAFIDRDVQMPDGRGSFFDVIDKATARGLDVRLLFWRFEPHGSPRTAEATFWGDESERAWLSGRGSRFLARWDHNPGYCHHQKSWLIDAGQAGETAFVGGINLHTNSVVAPGHPYIEGQLGSTHDVYVELQGPIATDVRHNFIQRWNEATERGHDHGVWQVPGDLPFPTEISPDKGEVSVQITRTVRQGAYSDSTPPPGGQPHPIAEGDGSMLEQYVAAIDASRESIYFENQGIGSPVIIAHIEEALKRGVNVTFLVPGRPPLPMTAARRDPGSAAFFQQLARLGQYDSFLLAGIAGNIAPGRYHDIYVHAKVALIDDTWATIGSTNVANRSFHRDTELNASFWHPETVRALRAELLQEHVGIDTSNLGVVDAMRTYKEVARANTTRRALGEPLEGLAHEIDPAGYGL